MLKKSSLYETSIHQFFLHNDSSTNKNRLNIFEGDKRDMILAFQQATIESTIEVILNILVEAGVIENDCDITSEYRANTIMKVAHEVTDKPKE